MTYTIDNIMARPTGNNLSAPSQDSVACVTVLDDPWRVLWCIAPYSPRCMTWHIPRATKQNSLPTWCIPWHVPRHNWLRGVCRGDLWQTPWIHSWFGIIHGASHVVFHGYYHDVYRGTSQGTTGSVVYVWGSMVAPHGMAHVFG